MMERLKNMWNMTYDELLNKVSWPTWDELRQSTYIVLGASIIFALIIWILDFGLVRILQLIYDLF